MYHCLFNLSDTFTPFTLSFNTKQDILDSKSCQGQARHVEFLLQDSVDDNLAWKKDMDKNHPLRKVCDYIDEILSGRHTRRNQTFNLGEKLKGLTEPPYGLYQSYAPMAMVAFAMKKYVNQIYDTNGKQRSAQHLIDDVVEVFKAWESGKISNKLNFMFESKEAGKLCKNLIAMFSLRKLKGYTDISSLKDARWAIQHEYAKEKGFPLWSLKYCSSKENTESMRRLIDCIIKVVGDPESMKNPQLLNETISNYEEQKYEWGNMLQENNGGNYRDGFCNYMKSFETINLQDYEADEALEYLHGHLEGEVGLWKEDKVKDALKDWRIIKSKAANKGIGGSAFTGGGYTATGVVGVASGIGAYSAVDVTKKRGELLDKLKFMPSTEAKELLQELIEKEDGFILDTLLKYVQ